MAERQRGNRPVYNVRAKTDQEADVMTTIGAVWPFKDGDGFVMRLQLVPVNWDGSCILVPPKEE